MLEFRARAAADPGAVAALCAMGLPERTAQLMVLRGIADEGAARAYLNPTLDDLHDPFLLRGMREAVDRVRRAQAEKQRVCIYGDYDADGVTATALLVLYLRKIGLTVGYYIPDRHGEGYGLHEAAIRSLAPKYDLLLTVDCGITAVGEVRLCRELGLDVVVTDHHHAADELPDCTVVNPRLGGYPFPHLAGVGVAAKLVQALGGMEALRPYLDIVAIGTVADIVSLTGENRALVRAGLEAASRTTRPGILALMEVAGLQGRRLDSAGIGFALGPRINAGGRIGHSSRSVEMLCTGDRALARKIASELEKHNQIRQSQEQAILKEAVGKIEGPGGADFLNDRAIVCAGEGWNAGVIGIVASRLVERYNRPVFVLAREGDTYVGSARSIRGVSLFESLHAIGDVFLRYGGHDMAAGLTLRAERLQEFTRRINEVLAALDDGPWVPSRDYDLEVRLPELTLPFLDSLSCLEPLGQGNSIPVFLLRGVRVVSARTMGANDAHLRLRLEQDGAQADAAAFKMGWRARQAAGSLDCIVTLDRNTYMGRTSLRLTVKAFKPSEECFFTNLQQSDEQRMRDFLAMVLYNEAKPRFRRYLTVSADKARERVGHLLRERLSGTLLLYAAAETARLWRGILAEEGLLSRVGLGAGPEPDDPCAFNLLSSAPFLSRAQVARYRNIVLLDGAMGNGFVERLLAASPSAVVLALPLQAAAQREIASCAPEIGEVRALYKALRGKDARRLAACQSLHALRALLFAPGQEMPLPRLQLALFELRDMELIEMTESPFAVRLKQVAGKRDFYATATGRWLREEIHIDDMGGCKNGKDGS